MGCRQVGALQLVPCLLRSTGGSPGGTQCWGGGALTESLRSALENGRQAGSGGSQCE